MAEELKLCNQNCFPIYALSKQMIQDYREHLKKIDLTYPQYLVMMVLWEEEPQNVCQIGQKLKLDSGTLTPLLKRLEQKELVVRNRSKEDERSVNIALTEKGKQLKNQVREIPKAMQKEYPLTAEEWKTLKSLVLKILNHK